MASIAPADLLARIDRQERPAIVDVRTAAEFAEGHVPGAVNIPFQQVPARAADLRVPPTAEVIVYCGHGPRAWIAAVALRLTGFQRIVYLRGHWAGWRRARLRVERWGG